MTTGRRLWKLVKEGNAKPKLTVFSWDANLLTSEEVFEGEFHFWDTSAYPKEPELKPEDPSKKFSLPIAQRVHTLTARPLKRTHWLYEPESFIPAAQLVDTYEQHAQRMTGTGSVAYSSTVSTEAVTAEPQLYYIHTDHLGTPQELTDREGNLQWVGHYRAWGELAKANDSEGNAASVEMPLRFQGQYYDAETGLHYNRFRYYDPQIGRFTTQDPISLAGGVNLYQYAPNPVQWVDPLGLTKKSNDGCPLKNVQTLPPLKGKSTGHVEEILECNGYTCKNPQNPKNRRWVHEDGSEVQVHGYGNKDTKEHKSANNAHAHKSVGRHLGGDKTIELADDGLTKVSPFSDEAHIGLKNPVDFPSLSGRPHGI